MNDRGGTVIVLHTYAVGMNGQKPTVTARWIEKAIVG